MSTAIAPVPGAAHALVHRLIGRFVAEAREAGCPWTEIGERMGVSKQAARQRFTQQPAMSVAPGLVPGGRLQPKDRLLACL